MTEQLTLAPVDPLALELAWTRRNPEAWEAIVTWAHQDRAAGIDPSTRLYACLLRRPHFASLLGLRRMPGDPVLVNDHLTSGLARLLNRLYPALEVPVRAAAVDSWRHTT
jgi:hypothetical protein